MGLPVYPKCVGFGAHDAMLRFVLGFVAMSPHGNQKQCRNTVHLHQRCQWIDDVSKAGILESDVRSSPRKHRADSKCQRAAFARRRDRRDIGIQGDLLEQVGEVQTGYSGEKIILLLLQKTQESCVDIVIAGLPSDRRHFSRARQGATSAAISDDGSMIRQDAAIQRSCLDRVLVQLELPAGFRAVTRLRLQIDLR